MTLERLAGRGQLAPGPLSHERQSLPWPVEKGGPSLSPTRVHGPLSERRCTCPKHTPVLLTIQEPRARAGPPPAIADGRTTHVAEGGPGRWCSLPEPPCD